MTNEKIKKYLNLLLPSIGVGLFIGLLTITPVMAVLDIFLPGGFHATFEEFYLRWAAVCSMLSFAYFIKHPISHGS